MGLFGALFAGVSGVNSQANKIGAISNNISNVNTVGYKQVQATFNTLVVPSGTTTFSPGGVIGQTQNLVSQQGLIQATSSPTDVAITGNGFFAVNTKPDDTGSLLLTRSGSFTQDSSGNFVNANGFFLQGIPVTTPPTSVNLNSLKTVNINQNATGTATATSQITLGANLNAAQSVLLGATINGTMLTTNGTSGVNNGVTGSQILIGTDYGVTSNLVKGVTMTIASGSNTPITFTYGGYTIGRSVTTNIDGVTTTGDGDGATLLTPNESITAGNIDTTSGSNQITITGVANFLDYIANTEGNISGVTTAPTGSGLTPANINGEWKIISNSPLSGGSVTFQIAATATGTVVGTGSSALTVTNRTYPFTGNVLNATSVTSDFLASGTNPLLASNFTSTSLVLHVSIAGATPVNFTYSSAPSAANGTFNSLQTLVDAMNVTPGLTARINNGRIYISAADASQSVSFTNGDAIGNGTLPGINWVQELDLKDIPSATTASHTFNSLNGLANMINTADPADLLAKVNNPTASATITINEANPLQTINMTDGQSTSSILKELGIANLVIAGGNESTGTLPVVYNATSPTTDMSSGAVAPQFSHDITVYDSQGNSHTIAMNVVKIATNTWAVEFTAVPKTDVTSTTGDGQIAAGILKFDGNGVLTSDSIPGSVTVGWTNGASSSTLTFNLGLGGAGNVTQSAAPYTVSLAQQNGSPIGQLTGVTIDANGFVTETFSNGQTKQIFQVPLASVSNPDGLQSVSGDAFQGTLASGQVNLNTPGNGGTGTITPSSLEQSNVDLSTQLTNLIVAQQAYGANSKLLTVADQLLQQLDQIIQ